MSLSIRIFRRPIIILFIIVLAIVSGCAGQRTAPAPVLRGGMRIAVLPFYNLSGGQAPLKEIRRQFLESMEKSGMELVPEKRIEELLARHRIRYTGGIDSQVAEALEKELSAEAVLITTVELCDEGSPPKFALLARLVATGKNMRILWMDSMGLSGDEYPSLLGLGIIENPRHLRQSVIHSLTDSLTRYLGGDGTAKAAAGPVPRRFAPKTYYQRALPEGKQYRIAILPFHNETERKYGGEILMLHLAQQLFRRKSVEVIEPGVVRHQLLNLRMIMSAGVSLADVDLIADFLEADLILAGRCLQYEDYPGASGVPKVMFSTLMIERQSRTMVWSSASYNEGDNGVFFFDRGKVYTASVLASRMAQSVAELMAR